MENDQNQTLVTCCNVTETADFDSEQGRSIFEPAGVAALRRGLQKYENAVLDQNMQFQKQSLMARLNSAI